jgi:hypothetical protein
MATITGGDWTYSGDPAASSKDAVRHYIGDTNNQNQIYSNQEIEFAIAEEGSARRAAAALLEQMAASPEMVDKSIGDLSISRSQRAEQLRALAKRFRNRSALGAGIYAGGVSIDDKQWYEEDSDIPGPAFYRGQFDHPDTVQDGNGTRSSTGST